MRLGVRISDWGIIKYIQARKDHNSSSVSITFSFALSSLEKNQSLCKEMLLCWEEKHGSKILFKLKLTERNCKKVHRRARGLVSSHVSFQSSDLLCLPGHRRLLSIPFCESVWKRVRINACCAPNLAKSFRKTSEAYTQEKWINFKI